MTEPVRYEEAAPLAWVTLDRPQKANALDARTVAELTGALDAAERNPAVRALIIAGAGRNFCGGADLQELLAGGPGGVRALMEQLRSLLLRFERSRLAIVAAVQGAARAGGLEVALACDAVVAARSASFGDGHLLNSLLPAGGSTARLPRTIGWARARWMILSGAAIDAETSQAWGLVLRLAEESELRACAADVALILAGPDRDTFAKAKALLAGAPEAPFSAALEAEIAALQAHADTPAFRAGVSAFLAGRSAPAQTG